MTEQPAQLYQNICDVRAKEGNPGQGGRVRYFTEQPAKP
jgi:hypothetical protein